MATPSATGFVRILLDATCMLCGRPRPLTAASRLCESCWTAGRRLHDYDPTRCRTCGASALEWGVECFGDEITVVESTAAMTSPAWPLPAPFSARKLRAAGFHVVQRAHGRAEISHRTGGDILLDYSHLVDCFPAVHVDVVTVDLAVEGRTTLVAHELIACPRCGRENAHALGAEPWCRACGAEHRYLRPAEDGRFTACVVAGAAEDFRIVEFAEEEYRTARRRPWSALARSEVGPVYSGECVRGCRRTFGATACFHERAQVGELVVGSRAP